MNFLAHAYLSFGYPELLVGNLISDFVKGKKQYDYPPGIQKGITLHRNIDTFTDVSEATRAAKDLFRPAYRLYSGAFTDVVYDYFLANDQNEFPGDSLFRFSQEVYRVIDQYTELLPEPFTRIYPHMKQHNWLYGYRLPEGIHNSFRGLVRRSAYMTDSRPAIMIFEEHTDDLRACYEQLIAGIKPFAWQRSQELLSS